MKKFLIFASIFLVMIWFLSTGIAYLKPGSVRIVKTPNGTDILVNESKYGKQSFKWPFVPLIGWGEVVEEYELEQLQNFRAEFKFLGTDLRTPILGAVISGKIEVRDWEEFIAMTDPKDFIPALVDEKVFADLPGPAPTRHDLVNFYVGQQIFNQTRLPFWLAEIRTRAEFIEKISEEQGVADGEELIRLLKEKYPWIWAMGRIYPAVILEPDSAPPSALRYFPAYPALGNNLSLADRYVLVKYRSAFFTAYLKDQKIDQFLEEAGPEVREEAGKLVEEFYQYLKNQDKTLADFDKSEDLDREKENFLASLPSQPIFANTPDAFRYGINRAWVKGLVEKYEKELNGPQGLEEAVEKQVKPFFRAFPSFDDPLNAGLWQISLRGQDADDAWKPWAENDGEAFILTEFSRSPVFGIREINLTVSKTAPH